MICYLPHITLGQVEDNLFERYTPFFLQPFVFLWIPLVPHVNNVHLMCTQSQDVFVVFGERYGLAATAERLYAEAGGSESASHSFICFITDFTKRPNALSFFRFSA